MEYNEEMCGKEGKLKWKEGSKERVALRKYPVSELNGYIYVWISAAE